MGSYFSTSEAPFTPIERPYATYSKNSSAKYLSEEELKLALKDLNLEDFTFEREPLTPEDLLKPHVIYETELKDLINKYHPNDIRPEWNCYAYTYVARLFIHISNIGEKGKNKLTEGDKKELLNYGTVIINIINARNKEDKNTEHSKSRATLVEDYKRCLRMIHNLIIG